MSSLLALNFPLLLTVIVGLNLITWRVYRWDKAQARNGGRRVPERTLLTLAACGGIMGAFVAIYAHRQRHKAQKASFLFPLYAIAFAYLGVTVFVLWPRLQ
ncbi:MAG: DUF1294 domain-containing protein [Chloroflexota bacterium]|nr:DUF1294 domain-containing protein [Chloroflexota bacterium]